MQVTQTINYGWRTVSHQYTVDCQECQKTLYRTVSSGCNDLADAAYIRGIQLELKIEAEKASKEEITCTACLKSRICSVNEIESIPEDVITMSDVLLKDYYRTKKALNAYLAGVSAAYHDRIIVVNKEEWVLTGIYNEEWRGGIEVHATRISKVKPWLAVDDKDSFKFSEIEITRQTLKERVEQVGSEH